MIAAVETELEPTAFAASEAHPGAGMEGRRVVVVGGGYGGVAAAKALDEFAEVLLVEPRDQFVHNVAALRALVAPSWLPKIFFPYDHLLANGRIVRDRAVEVDAGRVALASGGHIACDFVVVATGSRYPFPAKTETDDTAAAIERIRSAHDALVVARRVLILGAGPVGIELAGEIAAVWPEKQLTIVDLAPDVLAGDFADALRVELRRQLTERGVELLLDTTLSEEPPTSAGSAGPFTVVTTEGRELGADIWFRCHGVRPSSECLGLTLHAAQRPDGFVEVNEHLQLAGQETVFALGDVAAAGVKMASRAVAQAQVVAANIQALVNGGELQIYEPYPPAIVIPLGPEGGAGQLPGQQELAGPEVAAEIKGRDMHVDQYRTIFNLP
jgi:NADH dehydrogenase FAD-containing subunit